VAEQGEESVRLFRVIGEFASGRTNQQHKTHKTDFREIYYPWHPLHKQRVSVHFELHGRDGVVVRCGPYGGAGHRGFDIPAWMFDRAACSAMVLSTVPAVDLKALTQLRRLLDCALGKEEPGVIEGGHRLDVTQGGADGETLQAGRATGVVSPTEEGPWLDYPSAESPRRSDRESHSNVPRSIGALCGES